MAINKTKKQEKLKKLEEKISQAKSIIFVGYEGLKSKDQERLRKIAKESGNEFTVVKKTILNLALNKLKLSEKILEKIEGEIGLIFGYQDEIMPAKISVNFSKENDKLKIKGGILENEFIDLQKIKFLANLSSKNVLQTQLLFSIKSPIFNLISVLKGNLRSLVYILNLISQKNN